MRSKYTIVSDGYIINMRERRVQRLLRHTDFVSQPRAETAEIKHFDCYSKIWDPAFSEAQKFKEHHQSWVEEKRKMEAVGDDIDILLQDAEGSVPSCQMEEVREFCRDARLENLASGTGIAGVQRRAWLDDRSSHRRVGAEPSRKYENPLTAKALCQALEVKV